MSNLFAYYEVKPTTDSYIIEPHTTAGNLIDMQWGDMNLEEHFSDTQIKESQRYIWPANSSLTSVRNLFANPICS